MSDQWIFEPITRRKRKRRDTEWARGLAYWLKRWSEHPVSPRVLLDTDPAVLAEFMRSLKDVAPIAEG